MASLGLGSQTVKQEGEHPSPILRDPLALVRTECRAMVAYPHLHRIYRRHLWAHAQLGPRPLAGRRRTSARTLFPSPNDPGIRGPPLDGVPVLDPPDEHSDHTGLDGLTSQQDYTSKSYFKLLFPYLRVLHPELIRVLRVTKSALSWSFVALAGAHCASDGSENRFSGHPPVA